MAKVNLVNEALEIKWLLVKKPRTYQFPKDTN